MINNHLKFEILNCKVYDNQDCSIFLFIACSYIWDTPREASLSELNFLFISIENS